MKATLPKKPGIGINITFTIPASWSWRLKAAALLFRLGAWILGSAFVLKEETPKA